jgi:hypothetical protein
MKNLLTYCILTILTFGFTLTASSQVFRKSQFYKDIGTRQIDQFIVEYPESFASEIQKAVSLWCAEHFMNPKVAEKAEGDGFIIMKASLPFTFKGGVMTMSGQIKCETKFEFREGRMRVTITDLPHSKTMSGSVVMTDFSWWDGMEDVYDFQSPYWLGKRKRRYERDFLPNLMNTRDLYIIAIHNIPLITDSEW